MAEYRLPCTNLELVVDSCKETVTLHRTQYFEGKFPEETVIRFDELQNVYNESLSFDVFNLKGTGTLMFEYPGCPKGGDMIFDALEYENMAQYKMKDAKKAEEIYQYLLQVIKERSEL